MNLTDDHAIERLEGQLKALTEVSKTLTLSFEQPELLDLVMKKIVSVLPPAHAAAVMLWDQPSGLFRRQHALHRLLWAGGGCRRPGRPHVERSRVGGRR